VLNAIFYVLCEGFNGAPIRRLSRLVYTKSPQLAQRRDGALHATCADEWRITASKSIGSSCGLSLCEKCAAVRKTGLMPETGEGAQTVSNGGYLGLVLRVWVTAASVGSAGQATTKR